MRTPTEIEAAAVDNPQPWAKAHIAEYLATDGAEVNHPRAEHMILLYTKGRRSGQVRRVPIVTFPDGGDLLVVASKGGAPQHPAWFFNLKADPEVWVRRKDEVYPAHAEILSAEERERVWPVITEASPSFAEYQAKTDRVIPVVRLIRK